MNKMKHSGNEKVTILIIFNEQTETFSKRKKLNSKDEIDRIDKSCA